MNIEFNTEISTEISTEINTEKVSKTIRVLAFPIADQNTGSSRIRCYELLNYLPVEFDVKFICLDERYHRFPLLYCPVSWYLKKFGSQSIDMIYIQKAAFAYHRKITSYANKHNIPVVYDIDDIPGAWQGMDEQWMLDRSNAVTVDTKERSLQISKMTKTPIYCVSACIDYFDDLIALRKQDTSSQISTAVTFGWDFNCKNASLYMDKLPDSIEKHYITNLPVLDHYVFHSWALDSFISTLAQFDCCVLAHDHTQDGQQKSNNRLIVSLAVGLPTIVSNTASYAELYTLLGFEKLIAQSPSDVVDIVSYLNDNIDFRKDIINKGREYALKTYHPKESAKKMGDIFCENVSG